MGELTIVDGTSQVDSDTEEKGAEISNPDDELEVLTFNEIKDEPIEPEDEIFSDDEEETEEEPEEEKEDEEAVTELTTEYKRSVSDNQRELTSISRELDILNKRLDVPKPEKPADDYDDDAMRRYETRLALWEDRKEVVKEETQILQSKVYDVAKKQENDFRKAHKNEDLNDFEEFVRAKHAYYLSFLTGDSSLDELFDPVSYTHLTLPTIYSV